jgi:hypothetical protein
MPLSGLKFGNVTEQDVVEWWDSFNRKGASTTRSGDRIFLRGWVSDDSGAKVTGKVMVESEEIRLIIPLINSEAETPKKAKDDIERKNGGVTPKKYLKINRKAVSDNNFRRVTFSRNKDRHFDGYWVSVSGLKKDDSIEFGGDGPRNFSTSAKYTVVK